jgi:acyl-CoA reductase-like NAD-dependent aldehyde dehydrogenase
MPRVQSNGLSIEVERYGSADAVPVLLISGLGSQLLSWPAQMIDTLTQAGFQVIAMDNRDVGLSEKLSDAGVPDLAALRASRRVSAEDVPYTLDDMAENAVSGAILGNFYASGQVCSNGTRVFVQHGIKRAFLKRLTERLGAARIGDPMDPETSFGPMVSDRQREIVKGYIDRGIAEGARLVCGGRALDRPGYYLQPTVFAEVTDTMTIAREEIFGPVMAVLDFATEDEVMARANATEFGLAAGVFTRDLTRAHRVAAGFEAGTCYINTYNLAPVEAPFGGTKLSGVGRENSKHAIDAYSTMKTVYVAMQDLQAPY